VSNAFGAGGGSTADSKQVSLNLSQLIDISGVSRSTVDAARFQRLSREMDLEATVNDVKNAVRSQFYLVLQTRALVKVQGDEVTSARQRLENARRRYEAGDISQFDVLRFETDLKRSEQELLVAVGDFELSKQGLNNLLGRSIDTQFDPAEVSGLAPVPVNVDEAVAIAQENRPEVRSGGYLVRSADELVDVQEGGLKPSLSVGAQYSRVIDPSPGQFGQSLFGTLTLSFPLWDSGITRGRVAAAKEVKKQAEIRLEQTKLGVSLEVRNSYTRLVTAKEAYDVAVSGLELAREALRLAQLRYDEGAGILLDVTTAQEELTRANAAAVTARYEYLTAVAALQRAIGRDDLSVEIRS
jgi:outer membrane protein TolC